MEAQRAETEALWVTIRESVLTPESRTATEEGTPPEGAETEQILARLRAARAETEALRASAAGTEAQLRRELAELRAEMFFVIGL